MSVAFSRAAGSYTDIILVVYRIVRILFLMLLFGFITKYLFCDVASVKTNDMFPTLRQKDVVLVSKTRALPLLRNIFPPRRNALVLFRFPLDPQKTGCLRIAGIARDTISIQEGTCTVMNRPAYSFSVPNPQQDALPPEFTPRDNMKPYRIPAPGDTVSLDALSIRDFIFTYTMIRQENPEGRYSCKPFLSIDDSVTTDYQIKDFNLYTGNFDAIPDSLLANWFFWDRLEAYCKAVLSGKKVRVAFTLMKGQSIETSYLVTRSYCFLLADDWFGGYDSRYFGPVAASRLQGSVAGILWSVAPDKKGLSGFRWGRIGKLVK